MQHNAHLREVWAYAVRRCLPLTECRTVAEDCVQEAFATACERGLVGSGDIRGWIVTVARRRAVDESRRRDAEQRAAFRLQPREIDVTEPALDDIVAARDEARRVTARLRHMPATTRRAVHVAAVTDRRSAAARLGMTDRALEGHLRRARATLGTARSC